MKNTLPLCGFVLFLLVLPPFAPAGEEPSEVSSSVHVNQVGYLPSAPKIALVSSPLGLPFQVQPIGRDRPILKGMLKIAEGGDAASGENVWLADFGSVRTPGEYELEVPGVGKSHPFRIAEDLYDEVALQSLRSFYFLRCGMPLAKKWAGEWSRDACHGADAIVYDPTAAQETVQPATGGWHDGSDDGKYTVNGISAAATFLLLYEMRPDAYGDNTLHIPESGNGVPDLLDEARWELEWVLRLQNPEGGIPHKVTSLEPVIEKPKKDEPVNRYVFPASTAATAAGSAVLAQASRLFFPYDATFSIDCLEASQAAWIYVERHPNDDGFQNPEKVLTKSFTDPDDWDERFWAAIELYLVTEEKPFWEMADSLAQRRVPLLSSSGYWGNAMPLAAAACILQMTEESKSKLIQEIRQDLLSMADTVVLHVKTDGFSLSLKEGEFTWGSNASVLQNALLLLLADRADPKEAYREAALEQLHYILGRNPVSRSYVTGFGKASPQNPYNPTYPKNGKVIPGFLVGGPNQFLNDGVLKRSFSSTDAPARMYLDDAESFSSNEFSVSWNAVLALVSTCLAQIP